MTLLAQRGPGQAVPASLCSMHTRGSQPPDTPGLLQEARTGIAGWHLYIKMTKRRDLAGELPPQHGHRGVAPGPAGMHGEAGGCAVRSGMSPWWHRGCGRAVLLFVENQSSPRSGAPAPNHHHCQAGSCGGAAWGGSHTPAHSPAPH